MYTVSQMKGTSREPPRGGPRLPEVPHERLSCDPFLVSGVTRFSRWSVVPAVLGQDGTVTGICWRGSSWDTWVGTGSTLVLGSSVDRAGGREAGARAGALGARPGGSGAGRADAGRRWGWRGRGDQG